MISEIGNAENEGLEAKDYHYSKLKSFEEKFDDLPDSLKIKYDFLLTQSTQLYLSLIHI